MNFTLHVWRQPGPRQKGRFVTYQANDIAEHLSFLELLDVVNEQLVAQGAEPIHFEHDCREGIWDEIWIEPWRARAFPVVKDLVVDRSALDRIIAAGGYISIRTGSAPEANAIPVRKSAAERALDAAQCIGCGACVAACPNASAMLFTSAKVSHLGLMPQGQPERERRVRAMVAAMDAEGFGSCTNHGACQEACPVDISVDFIARLNRDFIRARVAPRS
jgi:succinate dehydrogenase / fumarate reductase iron-sulfur subunit